MSVGLLSEILSCCSAGEDANHGAHAGVGSGLQIERRIANSDNFRDVVDACGFHRMKDHERGRTALRNIVTTDSGDEVPFPSKPLKN